VTILKYTDSSWKLSETRYWRRLADDWGKHFELTIDSSTAKRIIPKLSFEQVIDSIKAFRLDTVITQHDIHNFRDKVADGMLYTIEVSTKNSYRRLSYSNPSHYNDPYDKQISSFLTFMQKNLEAFVLE
jgi:hypothetical protein